MSAYSGLFAPGDARFVFKGAQSLGFGGFVAGTFSEFFGPYPVDRGEVTLLARNEIGFPIVLAVNSGQTVQGPIAPPRISANAAVSILKKAHPTLRDFEKPTLTIWMGETRGHLAWTFAASSPHSLTGCTTCGSIPEAVIAFVDAHSGQVLEERQNIWTVDVSGNVSGWATPGLKPDQANNPPTLQAMHNILVNISGGSNAFTDPSGNFTIANGGTTAVTVNAPLTGRWARVVNAAGTTDSLSQSVTPPGPANFIFNPAPSQFTTSQVNGYVFTTRVHDFVKSINPSYPGIDVQIPVNVNVAGSCNAFFSGGNQSINFYQAAATQPGCPNMAYSTVVWHEYGHFVINRAGTAQAGYGEGMSDTIANLLADHPWTGEDFRGPNTGPLRSAINSVTYPSSAPIHTQGMIVSGAFWGTLLQLNNTVSHATGLNLVRQWAINSILLHPPTISPGITVDVLTLDDTDSDITNGTPHYDEIAAGFNAKGLTAPPLVWLKFTPITRAPTFINPLTYSRNLRFVYDITSHAGTLDPSTPKVFYRVNGGSWQNSALIGGSGSTYVGLIPVPVTGSVIDWYLEANDTQGHTSRLPSNAPLAYESIVVASALQTIVEDMMETGAGWTVNNGPTLTTGAWFRANPNGTSLNGLAANPENDSSDAGANCFFTGQSAVGGGAGDQDVDGGPTSLISPTYDLSGNDAIIEYKRWFFNDDGDDFLTVDISNDNGATWTLVETVGGIQNTWVQRSFRLRSYITSSSQIKLRFSTSDEPNNSVTEAAIDHIVVKRIVP